jgi:flagellar hook-associated protein 2
MSMSIDGLVSGMDTTSLITQLLQAEAAPQTVLRTKLSAAQTAASGYRTVNTTFAAVRAAAEALTDLSLTAARKASTDSPNATATAGSAAVPGSSVTFYVTQLASTQSQVSAGTWSSATALASSSPTPAWPIEIRSADGTTVKGTVAIDSDDTITDAAAKINAADAGVKASVIKTSDTEYRLQITSATSGEAGRFSVWQSGDTSTTGGTSFTETAPGQNAVLGLGGGLTASSATNTFTDLLPGVTLTVSKADSSTPVTLTVANDFDSVATKMQALVDAVNKALTTVKTYTNNAKGSTAALKGEYAVTQLSGQLLSAVSFAVGADGSPATIGLQLSRDGKVTFDKDKFLTALEHTPDLAQRMVGGTLAGNGPNGVVGGGDDVAAVKGIAVRLFDVAKSASDTAQGSLVALANGQDSLTKDIEQRIEAWDLRLAKRKEMLTRQFSAMETALSGLRNQSTWLAGQINSLPSYG